MAREGEQERLGYMEARIDEMVALRFEALEVRREVGRDHTELCPEPDDHLTQLLPSEILDRLDSLEDEFDDAGRRVRELAAQGEDVRMSELLSVVQPASLTQRAVDELGQRLEDLETKTGAESHIGDAGVDGRMATLEAQLRAVERTTFEVASELASKA